MLQSVMLSSLLVSSLFLVGQQVQASMVIQVVDSGNFCTFLPPNDSTDRLIADSESEADAFCMGSTPKASGSVAIPSGFIQSAHFVATDSYVQITGQIDPSKANLDPTDGGGQYDIKAPNGASCADYSYFVNLVEPSSNTYCIRCCNDESDCNRGISEAGCERIVPGDYSGPMGNGSAPSSAVSGSSALPSSMDIPASPTTTTTSSPELPPPSSSAASSSESSTFLPSPGAPSSDSTPSQGGSSSSDDPVTAQSVDNQNAATTLNARSTTSVLVAAIAAAAAMTI